MIAPLGHLCVVLALMLAVSGSVASFLGGKNGDEWLQLWGRRAAFAVLGLVAGAVGLMLWALVTHDFSVQYVSEVGSRDTPLFYTVISLWGALEGSILFWVLLLSVYTALFLLFQRNSLLNLQPYITGFLLVISSFFLFVVAGPGDPFGTVNPAAPAAGCPADGCGPNPLLQNHPMMGLHPPLIYLGFVGLSVPYAIAMAALLRGGPDVITLRVMRRWSLVAWIFLSLGITAGMWWSYAVLGWGGYWSWDPVENAPLMPWLVTTAFLHSLQVQERRQMLKTWTTSLIIAAFTLTILGTFLTRSGVVNSVHSFTQSSIGPIFLAFLGVVLVGSLALLLARSSEMSAPGALDSAVCRETAFLANNLLFVTITFTVLLGTLFPLLADAIQGTQVSVGAPYFDRVAIPIGIALIFLMGVGPALPWGAARFEELQYRLLVPVAAGAGAVLLLLVLGLRGVGPLATFGLAAFVLAVTFGRIRFDISHRKSSSHEGWLIATRRLLAFHPRRYGGYLAHVGFLFLVIGIAASQSYGLRTTAVLHPGQSAHLDGYTLRFQAVEVRPESNRMVIGARIFASRAGQNLGTLRPSQNYYPTETQPVVTPAVREEPIDMLAGLMQGRNPMPDVAALFQGRNPFEDLYLVLEDVVPNVKQPQKSQVTLLILVNPLVGFMWLGGFLVGLGGAITLLPARKKQRVMAMAPETSCLVPEEASA